MRLELSIKTTYLPSWGTQEGIRELVQNAKDAETEFKAPMKIWHNNHVLRIENKGVVLPHEALLLGHTTKDDNPETIGHFGEGLKLAALCLTRAGHKLVIRSGEEVWKPVLVRSSSFQAEVLAIDISKGKDCGGVVIEVDKLPYAEWLEMRKNFLFLQDEIEKVSVQWHGEILLSKDTVGKVFVKGIFVQAEPKLRAGYNLFNAPTDRDRKVIASYDLSWRLGMLWANATAVQPDLGAKLFNMAIEDAPDLEYIDKYAKSFSDQAKADIIKQFIRVFGEDTIPLTSLEESKDIAHFGRKGVILPKPLARLLQSFLGMDGGIEGIKRKLGTSIVCRHSWLDMSEEQRGNLEWAIDMLAKAGETVPMEILEVVSFQRKTRWGLWDGKHIYVSIDILDDKSKTLTALIHEFAHCASAGKDGEKEHVSKVEDVWSKVVATLLSKKEEKP